MSNQRYLLNKIGTRVEVNSPLIKSKSATIDMKSNAVKILHQPEHQTTE